ncbi:MAG: SDR family oxidoreductase [Gammaproteobacteria bacterium]|nr:SDR family oxidoreductase [Gammaproteobacteria bacterium]
MKLKETCAIISGASQGLGFAIAKEFVKEGANVTICARDAESLYQAQKKLNQFANHSSQILAKPTDVSQLDQVEKLIAETLTEFGKIDTLVANAGIYGTKGPIDEVDWNEWSETIDINLKGTVLQCRAVLPHLKKLSDKRAGKIIILSGGGATKPMPFLSAYAASKAAVVRFAETLAEEVYDFNIDVNTIAPGALNTRLLDELLAAGPEKVGKSFYQQSLKQQKEGGTSLDIGASLCAFLASAESNGITGRLISAVWDPWKNLAKYKDELKKSDIYTLRRIVPTDRNQNWE